METTFLSFACTGLWLVFLACAACILVWAAAESGVSRKGSLFALYLPSAFYILTIYKDPQANRDALSYVRYSELAYSTDALCYLVAVRFEPVQALLMWASSNLTGGHHLYFAVLVAIIIASSVAIFRVTGPRFLLFTALTFPQFGFINSMATIRWGAALYALAAAIALLHRSSFVLRGLGTLVGVMLHFGTIVAAFSGTFTDWRARIFGVLLVTMAAAAMFPAVEISSGSGVRYILAFAMSGSLLITAGASLKNDTNYRDHLVLVGCSALISTLYFVSPHLTRFAVSLLFVSYLPLVIGGSPLLRKRTAVFTLLFVPVLTFGLELAKPSCVIWHEDVIVGPLEKEIDAGDAQYKNNLSFRATLLEGLTGKDAAECSPM